MTAATPFIDARVSRHIGTYSDAVAIPAGAAGRPVRHPGIAAGPNPAGRFRRGGPTSLGQRVRGATVHGRRTERHRSGPVLAHRP